MTTTANATASPPLPEPNALTAFFWEATRAGELKFLRCQSCGHFVHYPRPICNRCLSMELAPERVSGRAVLYSYTWAVQAFHPYFVDRVPYNIAVVELVEQPGLRMTTNIVDCPRERIRTGMALEVVFTEVTPEVTLPLFRPLAESDRTGADGSAQTEEK
ncbi:Zn-ribbon domain-containing OB-fold protein [Streptosporangium sp. NPDC002607]